MISPSGVVVAEGLLLALTVVLFGARVMVHMQMRMRALLLSDAFLLCATLACLGVVICDILTYKAGAMTNFADPTISILRVRFATNYLFDVGVYLPKFSILAFYFMIIPLSSSKTRKSLFAVTLFVVVSALITFFGDTFWCGSNPAVNWSKDAQCTAFTAMHLVKLNWSLNIISEVLIFLLPLPIIRNLKIPRKRERAGLLVLFLLGVITIAVSAVRFIAMLFVSNDIKIYVLATTEFAVSIMIPSLISLRPLLRKIHGWTSSGKSETPLSYGHHVGAASGKRRTGIGSNSKRMDSHAIYSQGHVRNIYGSEVELTEHESGKIYKTEEISVTSTRNPKLSEEDNASR